MSANRTDWNDYDWQLIHEGPQPPALHMALDAAITDEVGAGLRPPTLRIWEWAEPAVVIGRFQSLKNEVDPTARSATASPWCGGSAAAAPCSWSRAIPSPIP